MGLAAPIRAARAPPAQPVGALATVRASWADCTARLGEGAASAAGGRTGDSAGMVGAHARPGSASAP
jgi:hypothetical protein